MNKCALLLLLLCLSTVSCSTAIISRGQYRDILKHDSDKALVQATIGQPLKSGNLRQGALQYSYDYFRVKGRVIPNEYELSGHMQGIILSLGIFEIFAFPASLVMVPIDSRKEHDLWVFYFSDGKYMNHNSDSWPYSAKEPDQK